MHHRGGGVGHTTGHNAEVVNNVTSPLQVGLRLLQNNIALARPVDEDMHTVEELVQEAEIYEVDGEADGRRELENQDDSDEAEESGSDADSEGDASEEEPEEAETRRIGNFE